MADKTFTYFDGFSGIGGFSRGIQQAHETIHNIRPNELADSKRPKELHNTSDKLQQWECVGYSEIDKYAIQTYEHNFPNHKPYGDITKIDTATLPDFDCFTSGFPCQSFSIAGKRRGFEDTRGTLFFECARIIRDKRPRNFVLENVKGLLSHEKGETFKTIIRTLDELGYFVEWQVLNSKNFGVPQNRERVFIIGHSGGIPRRKVFPLGESNEIHNGADKRNEPEAEHLFSTIATNTFRRESNYIKQINNPKHSNDRVYGEDGISPTLNTMQGGNRQPFVAPVLTPDRANKRQNGRRFKENGEPSFTITAQDKHGIFNGSRIRRLTPLETLRLQGFPDNWFPENMSNSQRYKQCGNAVTVNVIQAIFEKLLKFHFDEK